LKPGSARNLRGHDYSLDRPENAPNSDIFGHNPERRLTMHTLAIISILALIAIGGAAYTDQILTSQQIATSEQVAQRAD
jgi:hypothetical protein